MSPLRSNPITLVPDARRSLLTRLKEVRWSTISQLAAALGISPEAVRQQISLLERDGWVVSNCGPEDAVDDLRARGRPAAEYCLSAAGDDLFPKQYAELAITFFDALDDPVETLSDLTDSRVAALEKAGAPLDRAGDLRSIYFPNDPFTDIETTPSGFRLIENNCPYLNFAKERPVFCSTTVSALRRATDHEVVREERFQDGDGRCVFHVYAGTAVSGARKERRFELEPEKSFKPQ